MEYGAPKLIVGILLLVVGGVMGTIGGLLTKDGWNEMKASPEIDQAKQKFREETFYRLRALRNDINSGRNNLYNVEGGKNAEFIDDKLRTHSLSSLIYNGWNDQTSERANIHIPYLNLTGLPPYESNRVQQVINAVSAIEILLKTSDKVEK